MMCDRMLDCMRVRCKGEHYTVSTAEVVARQTISLIATELHTGCVKLKRRANKPLSVPLLSPFLYLPLFYGMR